MALEPVPDDLIAYIAKRDFHRPEIVHEITALIDADKLIDAVKLCLDHMHGDRNSLAHAYHLVNILRLHCLQKAHDRRVTELLEANNAEVERRRTAEARVSILEREAEIRKAAVERWVPCPDHRDKIGPRDGCQVCQRERAEARCGEREPLAEGREHLTVAGKFQSDKYPWAAAGFVPLKTSDPMAEDLLAIYAERRRAVDASFADDLLATLPPTQPDRLAVLEAVAKMTRKLIVMARTSGGTAGRDEGLCAACDAAEDALARLAAPAPAAAGWLPMHCAPRDGTKIDLLYPYPRGRAVNCSWDPELQNWAWREPRWCAGILLSEEQWARSSYPGSEPTHWMPAPALPLPEAA